MATCPKCGYEWQSKATAAWITCPGCQRKFRRPPTTVTVLARNTPLSTRCAVCDRAFIFLNCCKVDDSPAFVCDECLARLTT